MSSPAGSTDPELVYHYTNAEGLLGILSHSGLRPAGDDSQLLPGSASIRATDALYLNDPLELEFGRRTLARHLDRRLATLTGADRRHVAALVDRLKVAHHPVAISLDRGRIGTFVACFSRDPDLLSQWRGYAGGRGYAIGFRKSALENMVAVRDDRLTEPPAIEDLLMPTVAPVRYGTQEAEQFLSYAAERITGPDVTPVAREHYCQLALALVKQQAYIAEQEERLVVFGGSNLARREFRTSPIGVVPFLTLIYRRIDEAQPLLIREVRIGPGDHAELREAAVLQLLDQLGMNADDVTVLRSTILFRG